MTDEEYKQYAAFLRPDQWKALDERARRMGLSSRQPLLRWAVDAFLASDDPTYRIIKDVDQPAPETAVN